MKSETIELHTGAQVFKLLDEVEFQKSWDSLQAGCTWATIFQSRKFVITWYKIYQSQHTPIVITAKQHGRLTGLLTLAKQGKMIRIAGTDQAEYSAWIAEEYNSDSFIQGALQLLLSHFPRHTIYLKYLPEHTPLKWVNQLPWKRYCMLKSCKQPLLKIDPAWTATKLKRRSRRNEVNQLKRLGTLSFDQVTGYDTFAAVLDDLIVLSDFRKGAIYNKTQFQHDANRKEFLLALFKADLLHVTLLKVDNAIVSAHVNTLDNKLLHAKGINAYAPQLLRLSPGILHILLLTKMLAEQAFEYFDLTPGGESYKDDLATHFGEVYILTVYSRTKRLQHSLRTTLHMCLKRLFHIFAKEQQVEYTHMKKLRQKMRIVKDTIQTLRKLPFTTSLKLLAAHVKSLINPKTQQFIVNLDMVLNEQDNICVIHKNCIRDLLSFEGNATLISNWQFLRDALRRLEKGDTVYTWCKEGRLLGCAWLKMDIGIFDGLVQLDGIHLHYFYRTQMTNFLKAVIDKVKQETNVSQIYVLSKATDKLIYKSIIDISLNSSVRIPCR